MTGKQTQSYFFYILRCIDNTLYCGITTDLTRRVEEHNNHKKGAKYTKSRRPVELMYCEQHGSVQLAMKREIQVKKWSKAQKEKLLPLHE